MNATFVDLRKRSKDIIDALRRNEKVTLFYRGKPAGVIHPIDDDAKPELPKLADHPACGIWADRDDMEDPTAWVQDLRKGRSLVD